MSQGAAAHAAVALLFLGLVLSSQAAELERRAQLRHGIVQTTRSLLSGQQRRRLSEEAKTSEHVWVVGLPQAQQKPVWDTLKSLGGHVLHPLPDRGSHHWLVQASQRIVEGLLEAHEQVTAALFPHHMKISPDVATVLEQKLSAASTKVVHPGGHVPGSDKVVLVALAPAASEAELKQLQEQVHAEVRSVVPASCGVETKAGTKSLVVKLCSKGVPRASTYLSNKRLVTWVDVRGAHHTKSLLDGAILQNSPLLTKDLNRNPAAPPPEEILHGKVGDFFPLWKEGLTGKGQVVGVLDTGLDMDSCFFWDPHFLDYRTGNSTRWLPKPRYMPRNAAREGRHSYLYPVSLPNNVKVFENRKHRKVVQYVMWSDGVDGQNVQYTDGHGTHVSSIIAGSAYGFDPLTNPMPATGVAPDAKLAIFDAGSMDITNNSQIDLFEERGQDPGQLYELQRRVGARITSTSVGPNNKNYLAPTCYLLDAYAWEVQDTLHVMAAGNAGSDMYLYNTTGSVEAPATCKNVLSVGAAESWVPTGPHRADPFGLLDEDGYRIDYSLKNHSFPARLSVDKPGSLQFTAEDGTVLYTLDGNKDFSTMQWASCCSGYTSQFDSLAGIRLRLVLPDPETGCNLTQPYKGWADPVMVLLRKTKADNQDVGKSSDSGSSSSSDYVGFLGAGAEGHYGYSDYDDNSQTCNAAATIQSLIKNKASAALFYWENKGDIETSPAVAPPENAVMPTAIIKETGYGDQLRKMLIQGKKVYVQWLPDPRPTDLPPYENVAWFSSFGSGAKEWWGYDCRIKPELVAPGYQLGAHSDGKFSGKMDQCAVIEKAGTSMAAPVVAGAAAIVRQYFTYGYYPSGSRCSTCKHEPSAPLMKAVLIAGTAAMKGVSMINKEPLQPPPSPYQGFGRLDLSASLPLKKYSPEWKMQVVDGAVFEKDGIAHKYTLEVVKGAPWWHLDAPPFVATLVWNDFPGFPGARQVLVNNLDLVIKAPSGKVYWGNKNAGGDYMNNVEKVYIPAAEVGTYHISVHAAYVFVGARPQRYSLVVLGNLKGELDSAYNPSRDKPQPSPSPTPSPSQLQAPGRTGYGYGYSNYGF